MARRAVCRPAFEANCMARYRETVNEVALVGGALLVGIGCLVRLLGHLVSERRASLVIFCDIAPPLYVVPGVAFILVGAAAAFF